MNTGPMVTEYSNGIQTECLPRRFRSIFATTTAMVDADNQLRDKSIAQLRI